MLKSTKGFILCAAAAVAGLSSCSDESPWTGSDSEGGIRLEFTADGRVMRQTRGDDNVSPVVPEADSFTVTLRNGDGSYNKTWNGIEAFNREGSFPIGDYSLSASFGDLSKEGFNNPYFYGSADVHVTPSSETEAKITATLANSMVSVRYTDAFIENFPKYSASVQSEGHEWVMFAQDEDRPAYIAPGNEVKLNLTLTDTEGREVTVQPASFEAKARHHYIVTIDVNGQNGNLALNVVFEENVVNQTIEVSLDDDLFTSQPPQIKAVGFESGATIDAFEGLTDSPTAEFQVFTFGGLSKTNLNFETTSSYLPAFGKNVQLVNADAAIQSSLAKEGVECIGFFKNPEKMAIVRVTDFLNRLPAGSHTIELQAVDALTRVSDPVKLTVNIQRVQFDFGDSQSVMFGGTSVTFDITTNCPAVKDKLTFRAPDSNNKMTDVTVSKIEELADAGALGYTYRYTLAVAPQLGSEVDVEATYNGTTKKLTVPVIIPEYEIEPDAYAHHVNLRVTSTSIDVEQLVGNLKFYNNGSEVPKANISFDPATGLVTIVGLNEGVTYEKLTSQIGKVSKPIASFTTENALVLPNGDFSLTSQTLNIPNLKVGGEFYIGFGRIGSLTHSISQIYSSIVRNTPDGWANLNELTCYSGSTNQNTWYMVPSAWTENGKTTIRSVGYNHDGKEIPGSDNGVTTIYYCQNVPDDGDLIKASGELFLGQYSYNNGENRVNGINWSSRPMSLSFNYSYTAIEGEKGEAYITLEGEGGEILATKTVLLDDTGSSEKTCNISLNDYKFGKGATKLILGFKSTSGNKVNIKMPESLAEGLTSVGYIGDRTIGSNSYHAVATGSVLTLSNVVFGYDVNAAAASAAKRRNSNKRR